MRNFKGWRRYIKSSCIAKQRFSSREEARIAMEATILTRNPRERDTRATPMVYQCPFCDDDWHWGHILHGRKQRVIPRAVVEQYRDWVKDERDARQNYLDKTKE